MRHMLAVLFIPNSPAIFGISNLVVILGAVILIAVVALIIGLVVLRNGGKSKQPTGAGASMPDWQRQGQPVDNAWGQQQPQPGAWGAQGVPQQQPQPGAWGAQGVPQQQPQPGAWGAQGVPQQQPQPGAWGAQGVPQQPQADSWGMQSAPPQQQQAGAWGSQPSWDAAQSSAGRDSWGQSQPLSQPQQQSQPAWGSPSTTPASSQPAPTSYGGGQTWGQTAQPADPWATPSAQQPQSTQQPWPQAFQPQSSSPFPAGNNSAAPPWQQQGAPVGGNFGPVGAAQEPTALYGSGESDRTMLRNTGPQGRLGVVRVEEGKDPGRIYEVRKDSLSIGRSRESDIFLEDLAVSRLHASIVNMGNGNYGLKDEGSANGTKINGQLVPKNQMYPLQEGDKIQLGQTVLVFGKR